MEDSYYSELKNSLSTISVKALNYTSRLILVNSLNFRHALLSEKGFARDFRGLAELVGFQFNAIKKLEEFQDPTMKILESWETRPDATLDKLITYLKDMDRHDIIQELTPSLKKNVEDYLKHQNSLESQIQAAEVSSDPENWSLQNLEMYTRDDQESGERTMYDAFVFNVVEDESIVEKISTFLESPQIGLRLYIHERDKLPGCCELSACCELLKHRCRCVLIILTPNFLKSPAMAFWNSFAISLAIHGKELILVPVIFAPCEIPPTLNCVTKIDFTKQNIDNWEIYKLITSLVPEDKKMHVSTACSEMYHSAACIDMHQSAACYESKEASAPHKKSSKKFQQFMSFLKRKVISGPVNLNAQEFKMLTGDDVKTGKCTLYDAYVCYVDEDACIVKELAKSLESPLFGFKLFIRGRDMLFGCIELDCNIELIKKRCRRMLIILTPDFIENDEMLFYLSFAGTLSIEQKERILVPVILEPCEIPLILKSVYKIDFTKQNIDHWVFDKLIASLKPEDKKMHQSKEASSSFKQFSKKFQQFKLLLKRRGKSKRTS